MRYEVIFSGHINGVVDDPRPLLLERTAVLRLHWIVSVLEAASFELHHQRDMVTPALPVRCN